MTETTTATQSDQFDVLLAALAVPERRTILTYLHETNTDTISLDALASVLTGPSPTDQDHARIRLHHSHLPTLDDAGILDYHPDTMTVEYHGHPDLPLLFTTRPTH